MKTLEKPTLVSLIGPNEDACSSQIYQFGTELGKALIDHNFWIVCGGRYGFMEAVCKGAHQSEKYSFGCTTGIIPQTDRWQANVYCDIVIPTGLGVLRNGLVVNTGQIIIAVAGGSGTLSEIALAWQQGKKIICYTGFEGWAQKLAGTALDSRRNDTLIAASSLDDIMHALYK